LSCGLHRFIELSTTPNISQLTINDPTRHAEKIQFLIEAEIKMLTDGYSVSVK
jgi:hypothetical protein